MRAIIIEYDIPEITEEPVSSDETILSPWDERALNKLIFIIRQKIRKSIAETGRADIMIDIR